MPPKKKPSSELCSVCCQAIVKGKDELLFCGGVCQQRLHRYCAGVSAQVYKNLTSQGVPFYCFACSLAKHREEIDSLKSTVEAMKIEIAQLKSHTPPSTTNSVVELDPCVAVPTVSKTALSQSNRSIASNTERKYNVILYGLDECPKGTPRSTRIENDLNKAISILSKADKSITSLSIKDAYRLGRLSSENKKPRPLLVKFIRVSDALKVLAMRRSTQVSPIIIKPDMSPEERRNEALLLKERWSLIQSGVPREVIKIRGHRLLVRNKLYGEVSVSGSGVSFSCPSSCSTTINIPDHNALPSVSGPLHASSLSQPHSQSSPAPQPALNNGQDHQLIASSSLSNSDAPQSSPSTASDQ